MKSEQDASMHQLDPSGVVPHHSHLPMPMVQAMRPANAGLPSSESNTAPRFLLHVVRRWWKMALPTGVLLAILATLVVVLVFVPQYEAIALLEVADQPQYIAYEPRRGERSKAYFVTQMQLIQSAWIMGRVVAEPAIAELPEIKKQSDPIAWLSKWVKVSAMGESDAFTIAYTSSNPGNAALVVNEVASQYIKARKDTESARNKDIIRALSREMGARHEAVAALREQIGALAKQLTVSDVPLATPEPSANARHPLAELQSRLINVQVDRAMLGARVKAMEEQIEAARSASTSPVEAGPLSESECTLRDMLVERALSENSAIKLKMERIADTQAILDAVENVVARGKKSAAYQRTETELRRHEEALDKLKEGLRARTAKEAERYVLVKRREAEAGAVTKRREELRQSQSLLRGYEIAEQDLNAGYANYQRELEKTSGDSLDLLFKKDELSQSEMVLERITARQFELQTEQGAPARVIWHQEALPPQAPLQDLPYRNAGLAVLIGLCFPFGVAVGWERYVCRIGDSDCLRQHGSLPVLGETTRLPIRSCDPSSSVGDSVRVELEMFEESIDSLRTTLILSRDMRDVRVLAVTSAAKDEGKTSVAAQLATSLAHATNEMVLLIDGDLRSPDVHRVFGVALEPGLAEVLANECSLEKAIAAADTDGLICVLPAGRPRTSPHRLLGNGSWKSLIQNIPEMYRFVIVDTPPVLAASEALVLARGADASLMCVMRDVSRSDQVQKAAERLVAAGSHLVGAVLNGVPPKQYAYRYGRYGHIYEGSSSQ